MDLNHAAAGNLSEISSAQYQYSASGLCSRVGQTYFSIWTNLICNEFWKWSLLMLRSLHLWFVSPLRRHQPPVRQYASHKSVVGWGEAYISVEVYLCSKYSGGRFIYHRKTNIWHLSGPPSSWCDFQVTDCQNLGPFLLKTISCHDYNLRVCGLRNTGMSTRSAQWPLYEATQTMQCLPIVFPIVDNVDAHS